MASPPVCLSSPLPVPLFGPHERKRLKVAPSHLLHQDEWEGFPAIVGMCVDYKASGGFQRGSSFFFFPHIPILAFLKYCSPISPGTTRARALGP